MKPTLLIVEDDDGLRSSLEKSFSRRGYNVIVTTRVSSGIDLVQKQNITLALVDIRLPDGNGLDFLSKTREIADETAVIMMTAYPEIKTAVRAMKEGARDLIIKPFELEELHLTVERAIETLELKRNVRRLERERKSREEVTDIVGESPAIEQVRSQILKVAEVNTPVLIVGETGTGKELVADSLHKHSLHSNGPLVKVNCSAFSEHLLESELFGHEKGAFTDAREARGGLFEMADAGTLFLDEISEMKLELQAKLLRVVEGQPFRRVGGQREIRTNVRVVAATNRDLPTLIKAKEFREDLYFRLNVFQIKVPPLRSRGNDIVLLARFFLQRLAKSLRKGRLYLTPQAEQMLLAYDWPGNIRQLRNVMERAAILSDHEEVGIEHLPGELQASSFLNQNLAKSPEMLIPLSEIERRYMLYVLESVNGNISEASRILGVARNTLKARLRLPEEN
ncbi:MAG: sigma-54-dependent Fis family transcriptional regulator [Blastocatellia bacterium]|nr:sigma-54-dependent Fis family transcriptional regulator [Blastocatellia bacterium]